MMVVLIVSWKPNASDRVWTIAVNGEDIYTGGDFLSVGGQSRNHIAKLNNTADGGSTNWNPSANDCVKTIARSGSEYLCRGRFYINRRTVKKPYRQT